MQLVTCSASVVILMLFVFVQDSFFTSNYTSWQESFWNRRINLPSKGCEAELIKLHLSKLVTGEGLKNLESTGISCSSTIHSEQCVITEPIIFDKQSLTIYIPSNNNQNPPTKRTIKPYARRDDETAMDRVSPIHIHNGNTSSINPPACQITHNVPALVFSFGGFSDNTFHEFNEIVIPLFITSRHFGSSVQFVITDYRARWVRKFDQVFKHLSRYPVVDADSDETVHCFPAAVVGLRYHDNLGVNRTDIPGRYTIASFKQFLRHSYNLKVETILKPKRPKLLLLSRQNSRKFINEDEMINMMEQLGFQVHKAWPKEMSKLAQFAQTVNSCDMMVGAHGAGLTNQVFLPNGAVVVQIVPLGLEWASEYYFARPAFDMGLKYLGYKVEPNETSLYDLYGPNDPVISDPAAIWAKGYVAVKDVYVEKQDFIIDLVRFKGTLLEALKLLG